MIKELIIQNWENILVLLAFAILLRTTVFLDKRTILRMYALILALFIFSMIVFLEFSLENLDEMPKLRLVLMAIRYSTTPFIIALIIYTLGKYVHWGVFVPAIILVILDIISIFTGIVFSLNSEGELERGPLGYLPTLSNRLSLLCFRIRTCPSVYTRKGLSEIILCNHYHSTFCILCIFNPSVCGKGSSYRTLKPSVVLCCHQQ